MVTVKIPVPLRKLTGGETVEVDATSIADMVTKLEDLFPGIKERIWKDGRINRFINVYVGDEDIRFLQMAQTPLQDGDEVVMIAAIAGG